MNKLVLKNASHIYTCAPGDLPISNGYVVIQRGLIAEVGHGEAPSIEGADEIDCAGCIVTPGFINLHHHFFQTITRALPGAHAASSPEWLRLHYPVWAQMNPDELTAATRNAVAELVLSGATTSVDHAFMLGGAGSLLPEVEIAAVKEIGLRLHLVRACLPTIGGETERQLRATMGSDFEILITPDKGLADQCRADVKRWHDTSFGSMLQLALGPSNVPYTKPEILKEFAQIADETTCGLHMHYHPRMSERTECRNLLGCDPIEFLQRSGWLREGAWFAHCTELDDNEMRLFADSGTGVAHCPRTVLRLGYSIPRVATMRAYGVTVGIGVDGASSNDGGSFISDLRLGLLLHRCREQISDNQHRWLTPEDALKMATTDAAKILGRNDIGMLKQGMCADMAVFKLTGVEFGGSLNDPLGGFLLAGVNSRAFATVINGRVVVRNSILSAGDETSIASSANAASFNLASRTYARAAL